MQVELDALIMGKFLRLSSKGNKCCRFKIKLGKDRRVARYKVILSLNDSPKGGIDYNEVYSPVGK